MPREVMHRQAADNLYLHKDFHGALSVGLEYLHSRFGEQAVRDYIRQFAQSFYSPLREAMAARGLAALKEHLERIYAVEGGQVQLESSGESLTLRVAACPAVTHIKSHGYCLARLFAETTRTLYPAICEGTPYAATIVSYDAATGAAEVRFQRRPA